MLCTPNVISQMDVTTVKHYLLLDTTLGIVLQVSSIQCITDAAWYQIAHHENHLTKTVSVVTNSFRSDKRYKQLSTLGNTNQLEMNDRIQYILGIYCTYI